jgi:2-polyprenyl-3-methyl-5-hydroxy-6-metoxy-1,4-benzoquinol methylase
MACKDTPSRDIIDIEPLPRDTLLENTSATVIPGPGATLNRVAWQKPEKILHRLGANLHHKVIADIGAGPTGFFTFWAAKNGAQVIAIDISSDALRYIEIEKSQTDSTIHDLIHTRLAKPQDPGLKKDEVDGVLIVNTVAFIPDKQKYFINLHNSIRDSGKLVIVDFKMKRLPDQIAPPKALRVYADVIEELLYKTGYRNIKVDDQELEYQYIITADK